jgi:hypothetical protein
MTFDDWMMAKDCNYYPTDDTLAIRKLRECWNAAQKYGEVEQQLAERDAEILRLRGEVLKGNIEMLDANKQIVMLRDAVNALERFGTTVAPSSSFWEEVWPTHEKALATNDLSNYILCDAVLFGKVAGEPVYKARKI